MKDIDFDELDRAVNSLMSSVDPSQNDTKAANVQPSAQDSSMPAPIAASATPATPPTVAQPSVAQSAAPIASPQTTPTPTRPAAPAVRRSGRFMDMVNTSSAKQTPAQTTPSRVGLSVTPRQAPSNPVASVTPSPSEPTPAPIMASAMPDPLDMVAQTPDPEPSTTDTTEPPLASVNDVPAPLESPFIADAKVVKRPLNPGASLDPVDQPLQTEGTNEPAVQPTEEPLEKASLEEPQKGEDEPPTTPQVPELDSDLVAIESNQQVEVTQATETADAASQVASPSTPLGASSIAQQYKTTPSTGDQSHAAIYDASQYPQPIAHPAKQRSSWWWVLWVVLLLGVGAGGAILLYNLGII